MREALARSNLDFVASGTDRPESARLPRILRVASIATTGLVCAVIVVNALFLQDRKHPAPLLRAPDPVDTAPATTPVAAPRMIQTAPPAIVAPKVPGRDAIADEIIRVSPERKAVKAAAAHSDDDRHDSISALIGSVAEPSPSVTAAQKALVRLGYVLRADGLYGATTRQAVERYERDNKLPVRGELTPKLARELAAKSGIPAQ